MSNDFEKMVGELQESVTEDARKIYSEKVIERWLNPRNPGKIRNPGGFAKIKGPCGDTTTAGHKISYPKMERG